MYGLTGIDDQKIALFTHIEKNSPHIGWPKICEALEFIDEVVLANEIKEQCCGK